jgi:hypothetical protein
MTTQFTYLNKEYQVDIDERDWYNNKADLIIKVPNGDLVRLAFIKENKVNVSLVEEGWLEATEVDEEELAFQSLLQEYELTDNTKTRKLWYKCYEQGHSGGLSEIVNYWHDLVDLIKN